MDDDKLELMLTKAFAEVCDEYADESEEGSSADDPKVLMYRRLRDRVNDSPSNAEQYIAEAGLAGDIVYGMMMLAITFIDDDLRKGYQSDDAR